MLIENVEIKLGQTVRKVVYIKRKKHYAVLKCIDIQDYKKCHSSDIKRKSKEELSKMIKKSRKRKY